MSSHQEIQRASIGLVPTPLIRPLAGRASSSDGVALTDIATRDSAAIRRRRASRPMAVRDAHEAPPIIHGSRGPGVSFQARGAPGVPGHGSEGALDDRMSSGPGVASPPRSSRGRETGMLSSVAAGRKAGAAASEPGFSRACCGDIANSDLRMSGIWARNCNRNLRGALLTSPRAHHDACQRGSHAHRYHSL